MGKIAFGTKMAFTGAALGVFILVASQGAAAEILWPTKEWQTSTPEEQGMDSAALAKLLASVKTKSFDSLLVVRHGRIVLDAYYAPYTADVPHAINSATKAVTGTLTAIALKNGLLDSLDHRVLDFFAGRNIANLDDRKKAITIQNLLDMTSGLEWEEGFEGGREQSLADWGGSPDWVQFVLDRPMAHAPGEFFYYDTGNPHLLSAILTKLTGKSTREYAEAVLFGPLGIHAGNWRRDPQGIFTGGGGLSLYPRDMAKFGYLYLHNGEWEGKALLPSGWVERASHATINMHASDDPDLYYSNFFWNFPKRHVYMAIGYHSQAIMIFPEQDMVAVMTAHGFYSWGRVADGISGAVKSDDALPANAASSDLLANTIRDIATEKPTEAGPASAIAASISGKTYKFPDNAMHVRSLTFTLADPQPHYELEIFDPTLRFGGPIGLDGLYRKGPPTPFGVSAAKGAWLNEHSFVFDLQYIGSGERRKWTLSLDGERPTLRGKTKDGHDVSVDAESGG
jgi:CubicO group peptidase (beta-lactamase class C family)